MKKIIFKKLLMVFAIVLFANNLFAQEVYIEFNPGYNFSAGGEFSSKDEYIDNSNGFDYTVNHEVVKGFSFGKGLNLDGTFGVMMNENFGAELGLSYLLGNIGGKTKITETDKDYILTMSGGQFVETTDEYEYYANMLRINPSIVIASDLQGINPYAKFGLIIGSGSFNIKCSYENASYDPIEDKIQTNETIMEYKYSGGIALGYNASLGALFELNDVFSLFGEFNMINLSYAPTKGELITYTEDGEDKLSDQKTRDRETEFVESYTYDSTEPVEESEPRKELKQKLPFGSFGVNVGLRIRF
jgi:hypothetical protein